MTTSLERIVIDAVDPEGLAHFWAAAIGWEHLPVGRGEVTLRRAEEGPALTFAPVPEVKRTKNRLHFDLSSASAEDQRAIVTFLEDLGAHPADIGQGEVPWVVMADPEGNEFCVLEPRVEYQPEERLAAIVVSSSDPERLAAFWSAATGWPRLRDGPGYAGLRSPRGTIPWLEFVRTPPPEREVKNRVHLDIRPVDGTDQRTAVGELRERGASPVDIGQGQVDWVVLADPEGNEFCVLP